MLVIRNQDISKHGFTSQMLVGMMVMALAAWMYAIAAALSRARSIILEREKNSQWVAQMLEAEA